MYKITRIKTGKCYFGHARNNVMNRWNAHCKAAMNGSKLALPCAIRKYGAKAFKVEELGWTKTLDKINQWEKIIVTNWRIKKGHKSLYNMTNGGEGGGMLGKKHSFETRCLISRGNKGIRHSEKSRENMSNGLRLKWKDSMFREKNRVAYKSFYSSQRRKMAT